MAKPCSGGNSCLRTAVGLAAADFKPTYDGDWSSSKGRSMPRKKFLCYVLMALSLCIPPSGSLADSRSAISFTDLSASAKFEIEILLTASGYLEDVVDDDLSRDVSIAINRFQIDNGFPVTGSLTQDQLGLLKGVAQPVLGAWDLGVVRHPQNNVPLWIPEGLHLSTVREGNRLSFTTSEKSLSIMFEVFPHSDISAAFGATNGALSSTGQTISYSVLKPDFFVLSTAEAHRESYMRFSAIKGGVTGFWVMWSPDTPYHPRRLATVMADLFVSAVKGTGEAPPQHPLF